MSRIPRPIRRSSRALGLLAALALLVPAPLPASAADYTATRKLGRGLAGVGTGLLEIPGNVVEESRRNGAVSGATLGFALGVGRFVTRTLVGVYEVLSAPFASPPEFRPVLEPEFPWQYFGERGRALARLEADLRAIPGATVRPRGAGLLVTYPGELLFGINSAALSSGARDGLDQLAEILQQNPEVTANVRGYTDNTGSRETNRRLSAERAETVALHLTRKGVDPSRVVAQGFGAEDPVASNATPPGRRLNRRVEVELRGDG